MAIITTITKIRAPAERVFDLSRSVDLHVRSAGSTGETAVAGVASGLLELGQEVTWRGKHFGIWQNLTSKITVFSRPDHFRDSMVRGAFKRLDHDHIFEAEGDFTIMKDVFDFTSPVGVFGRLADALFLESYMRGFLLERNAVIRRTAEGETWKQYLKP
jgi:ligand-binding SRPBCC domain-containing protein